MVMVTWCGVSRRVAGARPAPPAPRAARDREMGFIWLFWHLGGEFAHMPRDAGVSFSYFKFVIAHSTLVVATLAALPRKKWGSVVFGWRAGPFAHPVSCLL